jgi:hypothetical protein
MTAVQKMKAIKSILLHKEMTKEQRSEHIARAAHLSATVLCAQSELKIARPQLPVHCITDSLLDGMNDLYAFLHDLPYEAF